MSERNRDAWLWAAAGAGALLAMRAAARKWSEYDLRGKTVLITGGSRGLGLVMAREFALEGAKLAICARDVEGLERARADLAERGARVLAVPCDVTERTQVNELVDVVRDHYGRIDVLVNNAGVIQVGPFEVTTVEDYEEAMATHFWGPLYTTLTMRPSRRPRISGSTASVV